MDVRDVLKEYRFKAQEIELMQEHADRLKQYLGYLSHVRHTTPMTAKEMTASRQLDRLNQYISTEQKKLEQLESEVDRVILLAPNLRLRYILRQYYVGGLTDEEIAGGMGISTRYVNRIRNQFLKSKAVKEQEVSAIG